MTDGKGQRGGRRHSLRAVGPFLRATAGVCEGDSRGVAGWRADMLL